VLYLRLLFDVQHLLQGGTCVLVGDDLTALEEMTFLVRKYIGCEVARGSTHYKHDGHHQEAFNMQPLQVRTRCPIS
jgi:hypothetical protein